MFCKVYFCIRSGSSIPSHGVICAGSVKALYSLGLYADTGAYNFTRAELICRAFGSYYLVLGIVMSARSILNIINITAVL